jgi:hypothetical protein
MNADHDAGRVALSQGKLRLAVGDIIVQEWGMKV